MTWMSPPGVGDEPVLPGQMLGCMGEVGNAEDDMIDMKRHRRSMAPTCRRLAPVKRYSPLIVVAALAALALAALKITEDTPAPTTWTPVRPT